MNNGRFVYSEVGSDEKRYIPSAPGHYKLTRMFLERAGINIESAEVFGYLVAYVAASVNGLFGIDAIKAISEEGFDPELYIKTQNCFYDVDIELPTSKGGEVVEVNPTDTSQESC